MEALAAMLILIPILAPAAASEGIHPVQFGVMVVLNLIIGHHHAADGRGAVRRHAHRRHPLRGDGAGDPAVADLAARGAGSDHGVSAADTVVADGDAGE